MNIRTVARDNFLVSYTHSITNPDGYMLEVHRMWKDSASRHRAQPIIKKRFERKEDAKRYAYKRGYLARYTKNHGVIT